MAYIIVVAFASALSIAILTALFVPGLAGYAFAAWFVVDIICDCLAGKANYGRLASWMEVDRRQSPAGFFTVIGIKLLGATLLVASELAS